MPSKESMAAARSNHERAATQWLKLADCDVDRALQSFLQDPKAALRPEQRDPLAAIMQRKLRVLVVMGTGSGKSMLFMLPAALVNDRVTIVIAPLNSLINNLLDRCDEAHIPCTKWVDSRQPPY